jgi:hypothetical protein
MAPRYLYVYHPPFERYPYLEAWLTEVFELARSEPQWNGCEFVPVPLSSQLGFIVAAEISRLKTKTGPVVIIHRVQLKLLSILRSKLSDIDVLFLNEPTDSIQIYDKLNEALDRFNGGHPRVSKREMIAFRIIEKLKRRGAWGGTALNKSFLRLPDIPNGGFPKHVSKGEVNDVVDALFNAGILERKLGDGNQKYGLKDKSVIEQILEDSTFEQHPTMMKFFLKDRETVPRSEIEYREDLD